MGIRAPRLFFITQAETAPPLFVVMTNEPEHIHFSYQRYLTNQLRKAFGFDGRAASRQSTKSADAAAKKRPSQTDFTVTPRTIRSTVELLARGITTCSTKATSRFHRSMVAA